MKPPLQNPSDTSTVLFTSFSLKPKEGWAHIVNFLNYSVREDEKKYRGAESKLREDIIEKKKLPQNKDVVVETTTELVAPFIAMFNERFVWNSGEYEISISVITSNGRANISKHYRFTLFESDSIELSKVKDDYKYGDGINWDSGKHTCQAPCDSILQRVWRLSAARDAMSHLYHVLGAIACR